MADIMQKSVIGEGVGYTSFAQPSVDIMSNKKSFNPDLYSLQSVFNSNNSIILGFARNDSNYDQAPVLGESQSALGALAQSQKIDLSVNINTASMEGDGHKALTNGANVADKRENGQQECATKIGQAQQIWTAAKGQAIECLKEAAAENPDPSINPSSACDSIVASESTSCKVSAAGATGLQAAVTGAGSLATAGASGAFIVSELVGESKKLSAKQKEDLCKEAYDKSQCASRSISDAPTGVMASAESVITPDQPDLSCLKYEQFKELLTTRLDQQPEMMALEQKAHDLNEVEENHQYAAGIYADNNLSEKMVAAADGGNALAQTELNNSLVYKTGYHYDSIDVGLIGSWLQEAKIPGAGLAVQDVGFPSVSEYATETDMSRVNQPALAQELTHTMHQQLRV